MAWFKKPPSDTPCWSCGMLQGKHGKSCRAVAGAEPGGPGEGGGQTGTGRNICGYRWTNPAKPEKRGQHFMHTCSNIRVPGAKDRMCEGPHFCTNPQCNNPTRFK